jgi:hypothetical protein
MKKHFALGILIAVFAAAYSPNTAGTGILEPWRQYRDLHLRRRSRIPYRSDERGDIWEELCSWLGVRHINTQGGTPIEWYAYGKYYFCHSRKQVKTVCEFWPCAVLLHGGAVLWYPGWRRREHPDSQQALHNAPDIQLGPVFGTGGALPILIYFYRLHRERAKPNRVFAVIIRAGIRYEI